MISEQRKEINGASYKVSQFGARRGLKVKTKLVKLIAPTIIAALGSGGKVSLDSVVDSEMLSKAIKSMLDNLDSDYVVNLIFELLVSTYRNDVEIVGQNGIHFDDVYAGNYGELYKAILFVVEVNFGSFFRELGIGSLDKSIPQAETPNIIRGKM